MTRAAVVLWVAASRDTGLACRCTPIHLLEHPRIDIPALTAGTLEGTIFPPQRMDVGLTLVDVEELVDV